MDRARRARLRQEQGARLPARARSAKGMDAIGGDKPFILHPDGVGWLFVTSGLKDGPLPVHYEPLESPFGNPLYPEHIYQSCGKSQGTSRQPVRAFRRRALPLRAHHLSPDRASHGRWNVASAVASGGVAARTVLRSLAGAGRRHRICNMAIGRPSSRRAASSKRACW